jgi:pyroglutamyl-peptidase
MKSDALTFSRRAISGRHKPSVNPRILVTGFGPFPDTPFNASQMLVQDLAEHAHAYPWYDLVRTAILPTDWTQAPLEVERLTREIEPDVILHLGVSSRTRCFEIESRAFNAARDRPDCSGSFPAGHYVRRGGPPVLSATLPLHLIRSQLRSARIPASLSKDAGRYLCNAVFYQSLLTAQAAGRLTLAGFIHIPALSAFDIDANAASNALLGWASLKMGLAIIINTMIVHARERQRQAMRLPRNRLKSGTVARKRVSP